MPELDLGFVSIAIDTEEKTVDEHSACDMCFSCQECWCDYDDD